MNSTNLLRDLYELRAEIGKELEFESHAPISDQQVERLFVLVALLDGDLRQLLVMRHADR